MRNIRRPIVLRQFLSLAVLASLILVGGCHSKGRLAGRLTIREAPSFTEQGLKVKDWAVSGNHLQLQLESSKDLAPDWLLTVEADNGSTYQTMTPLKMKAGDIQWIEIGGPKFIERMEVEGGTKSVTVGLRNQLSAR
jgi:hypothetical protein